MFISENRNLIGMKNNEEALKLLLDLFWKRLDLQDAYPEVKKGDFQALINWGSRISSKKEQDTDYEKLSKFKNWYMEKERPIVWPKSTEIVKQILKHTVFPKKQSLDSMIHESEIVDHLPTLYFLTIEFNLKHTLELGTCVGNSTLVLLDAAAKINGHVWSIDVDDCLIAHKKIFDHEFGNYWSFIKGNDIEIGKNWKQQLDHIFIDTSHTYQHTLNELKIFEPFLVPGGFITLHDTRSYPAVLKAVRDFVESTNSKFSFYNYFNCNGFAIMRKNESR